MDFKFDAKAEKFRKEIRQCLQFLEQFENDVDTALALDSEPVELTEQLEDLSQSFSESTRLSRQTRAEVVRLEQAAQRRSSQRTSS